MTIENLIKILQTYPLDKEVLISCEEYSGLVKDIELEDDDKIILIAPNCTY